MNYAGRCLKCIDCRVCHVSFKDYSVNQRLWKTIMQEKSWSHFLPIRLNGIAIGSVNSQSSCVFWNLSIAVQYLSSCIFQRSRTEETWVKWKWCYSSWMTTCWGLKSPNKCCYTSDMNNTVWKQLNRAKKKKKKSGTERCQWHWPLVFLIVLYLSRTIYIFTLGCFVLLVLECNIQWFLM